jgi:phosphodiesterase/alkaline phosphatase D-like protein
LKLDLLQQLCRDNETNLKTVLHLGDKAYKKLDKVDPFDQTVWRNPSEYDIFMTEWATLQHIRDKLGEANADNQLA